MKQEIPLLPGVAAQRFRTRLGDQLVRIELYYNSYSKNFYISLFQPTNEPIVEGLKLALFATPFRFPYRNFKGRLFWEGEGRVTLESIGIRHRLFYESDYMSSHDVAHDVAHDVTPHSNLPLDGHHDG